MAALAGNNPVLKALDRAKTQTYHFKAVVIAGMGFFTDAYDLFVIGILTKLLGRIYYSDATTLGVLPINVNAAVTGTALCGTLAGQLFFGWAGDKWGRKKTYGITLALMVVASLGQGLSFGKNSTAVLTTLCFFRFWLGFGVGGDYPLSATIMSEYSNTKTRGSFVAAVFAMQGIGILTAGAVTIITASIFNAANPRKAWSVQGTYSTPPAADYVWRIVMMFGAVPAAFTFYSRTKMPETARYTALVDRNQEQAALDMEQVLDMKIDNTSIDIGKGKGAATEEYGLFSSEFVRRHGLQLLGTSVTWFLLDISFYSQNLFQSTVYTHIKWLPAASTMSALHETYTFARANALIALGSTVPGYWFTVVLIDVIGRKPIALGGFFMMSLFLYILSFDYNNLVNYHVTTFVALYAMTLFFSNFGPNATTFIVPAELFPARLRSTCHGISSASGKAGAIVGAFGFLYASQDPHKHVNNYPKGIGFPKAILGLAIASTIGFVANLFLLPETKGKSLEELSGEDEENMVMSEDIPVRG
ncbi:unnamed protein product [Calypogeia fissa]